MSISKSSRFYRFLTGKGFYVALAACLIGTGAAAWIGVQQVLQEAQEPLPNIEYGTPDPVQPQTRTVDEPTPNVPKATPAPLPSANPNPAAARQPEAEPVEAELSVPLEPDEPELPAALSYVLPVDGECFLPFSDGKLVKSATLADWRTHDGVDIRAAVGDKVCAMADGTVTRVYNDRLWGMVLEITHEDSTRTRYCGLAEELILSEGRNVKQGDTVGTVGHITCESVDGPHLHLEAIREGRYVDPLTLLA